MFSHQDHLFIILRFSSFHQEGSQPNRTEKLLHAHDFKSSIVKNSIAIWIFNNFLHIPSIQGWKCLSLDVGCFCWLTRLKWNANSFSQTIRDRDTLISVGKRRGMIKIQIREMDQKTRIPGTIRATKQDESTKDQHSSPPICYSQWLLFSFASQSERSLVI